MQQSKENDKRDVVGTAWIGVDLDGTLAKYDSWHGVEYIGAPIPSMVNRVKRWLKDGKRVKIFTARVCPQQGEEIVALAVKAIEEFCLENFQQILEITCMKDWSTIEIWDDRCVSVEKNTGRSLTEGVQ